MMKRNGPSTAAAAAAAVADVLARPPRRATPETLSLDSVTARTPTAAETAASNTSPPPPLARVQPTVMYT